MLRILTFQHIEEKAEPHAKLLMLYAQEFLLGALYVPDFYQVNAETSVL